MRHSFSMNIRDADHTKYLSLESDNQVVTCACGSVELAIVWQRSPQAFQDPSWSVGVLYCASSGESVGNWRAQGLGGLRKRWSLRQVESRERCSSSEPL